MTTHTPGPWTAVPSKFRDGELIVQAGMPSNRILARFGDLYPLDEIDHANARLIAAAPKLLEALEFVVEQFTDMDEMAFVQRAAIRRARAAIAKATGAQP